MESVGERIVRLKEERNAVILAHNYCLPEVQDIADFVGDSLGLSRKATETDADVIVFCGVTFMAETAKILNPEKTVLLPDPAAVCAMAQMCSPEQIVAVREKNPGKEVVGYVNSTAACKAEMDVCCTSSNAIEIVSSLESPGAIFVPDRNLGTYAARSCPDKDVVVWSGFCPIHQSISVQQVAELKSARQALEHFKAEASLGEARQFLMSAKDVGGMKVVTANKDGLNANELRQMGDFLRDKSADVVAVLSSVNNGKVTFLAVCGKEAVAKGIKAGDLVKHVCAICGGKGGGKPDSAMGGGTDLLKLDDALASVDDFVAEKLG